MYERYHFSSGVYCIFLSVAPFVSVNIENDDFQYGIIAYFQLDYC